MWSVGRHCVLLMCFLVVPSSLLLCVSAKSRYWRKTTVKNLQAFKTATSYLPLENMFMGEKRRSRRTVGNSIEFSQEDKDLIVSVHNQIRAEVVGASNMVAVEWNEDLEQEAKRWASLCDFQHPGGVRAVGGFDGLGQNLFFTTTTTLPSSDRPIQSWESEGGSYIHNTQSCTPGEICGHYTQIIWAETTSIGCAMEYCNPITSAGPFTKGYFAVCEYGPSGNRIGEDPYKKGTECSQCPDAYTFCVDGLCSTKGSADNGSPQNQHKNFYKDLLYKTIISWFIIFVII